jgi:methylglutaconyl-CoA hydratase
VSDAVTLEVSGGVATLTLNRPESKNRLDPTMMTQVIEYVQTASTDPEVRVVVITGTGNTFCAGADLSVDGLSGAGPQLLVDALTALLDCPKPVIARVQGHVAGGGNGLVAVCDIAVAAADAKFAFTEVRVGVAPAIVSVVCLAVMHRRDAQELFITGERVDAARALRAGLLTSVAADGDLDALVAGYVSQCRAGGPEALSQTKDLLRRVPAMDRSAAFSWTADMSARLFASDEAREGMTAFLQKRKPAWLADSQD